MQVTTLSFENMHNHGELFANLFRARHQAFIVQNKWDLPQANGMEFDQYDTPASRWVAVHENGRVLAGIRLTPTTHRCGIYSYMIRDAQLGLLSSIPSNLLDYEAPVADHIWESSRVFVSDCVPANQRLRVQLQPLGEPIRHAVTRFRILLAVAQGQVAAGRLPAAATAAGWEWLSASAIGAQPLNVTARQVWERQIEPRGI